MAQTLREFKELKFDEQVICIAKTANKRYKNNPTKDQVHILISKATGKKAISHRMVSAVFSELGLK